MNHLTQASDNLNSVISNVIEIHNDIRNSRCTCVGDTINKFTAVVNHKWRITIFPEICIDCSGTNVELAMGVNDPMGQIVRWCH
jgi:hypothetical protein